LPRFCLLYGCDWKLSVCGEAMRRTLVSAPRV
jgi:hypothetical protein